MDPRHFLSSFVLTPVSVAQRKSKKSFQICVWTQLPLSSLFGAIVVCLPGFPFVLFSLPVQLVRPFFCIFICVSVYTFVRLPARLSGLFNPSDCLGKCVKMSCLLSLEVLLHITGDRRNKGRSAVCLQKWTILGASERKYVEKETTLKLHWSAVRDKNSQGVRKEI